MEILGSEGSQSVPSRLLVKGSCREGNATGSEAI
jgi:hypothetical protein